MIESHNDGGPETAAAITPARRCACRCSRRSPSASPQSWLTGESALSVRPNGSRGARSALQGDTRRKNPENPGSDCYHSTMTPDRAPDQDEKPRTKPRTTREIALRKDHEGDAPLVARSYFIRVSKSVPT